MTKKMSLKLAYQSPFMVYAVFSEQKCYRLAWLLNNGTDCEFIKLEDFRFPYHEENPKTYSMYGFHNSGYRMNVFLLENQGKEMESLIKGNPPIDFLLVFANIAGIYTSKPFSRRFDQWKAYRQYHNWVQNCTENTRKSFMIWR